MNLETVREKSKRFILRSLAIPMLLSKLHAQVVRPLLSTSTPVFVFQPSDSSSRYKNLAVIDTDDPATHVFNSKLRVVVAAENKYLIEELSLFAINALFPIAGYAVAVNAKLLGTGPFKESQFGISIGRSLGRLILNIQFNYHRISIGNYGGDRAVTGGVSLGGFINEKLFVSCLISNPAGGKFRTNKIEKIASAFQMHLLYLISNSIILATTISKEEKQRASVRTSLLYKMSERIDAMLGIETTKSGPFAGLTWSLQDLRISFAASYSYPLGFTPALRLSYAL